MESLICKKLNKWLKLRSRTLLTHIRRCNPEGLLCDPVSNPMWAYNPYTLTFSKTKLKTKINKVGNLPNIHIEKNNCLKNMFITSLPFASFLSHSRKQCVPREQGAEATFWLYSLWLWTDTTHLSTLSETASAVLRAGNSSHRLRFHVALFDLESVNHCVVSDTLTCSLFGNIAMTMCFKYMLEGQFKHLTAVRVKTDHICLAESSMQENLHKPPVFYCHLHSL